jgi:hypothetical protein
VLDMTTANTETGSVDPFHLDIRVTSAPPPIPGNAPSGDCTDDGCKS